MNLRCRALIACGLTLAPLGGCAADGVLELTVDLPPSAGPDRVFAFTQARDATDNPILDEWRDDADLDGVELTSERSEDHISLRAERGGFDVNVKVTFCSTPRCSDLSDASAPQLLYRLETPIFVGQRTSYTIHIPTLPTTRLPTPTDVSKCQIAGCTGGSLTNYCDDATGRHLCE